ncbi:MAG: hypothetical protein EDM69_06210 [Chlorobiota bacterium]|nr:MAG: hypothetical protein EDM69_06210 [Chlorobiota bacterium]MBV6399719.1 hypothetical protein [Ignavibacteria bacterium]MCE7953362.1 hypothetical protein [Chlorobi bacterium CHB7]RIK47730.1 MAG: hypothetical protein DCC60_09790 [Ignavibacteriota bacterium]
MQMKNKFLYLILIIIIPVILFQGCMEFQRNIKLNKDGSGSEELTFHIEKVFFDSLIEFIASLDSTRITTFRDSLYNDEYFTSDIRKDSKDVQGISDLVINSATNEDSSKTIFVGYNFDNVMSLNDPIGTSNSRNNSNYNYSVVWDETDEQINFRYTIIPAADEEDGGNTLSKGFDNFLNGKFATFKIEFPYEIISSNATETNGNTLTWKISMDEFSKLKEPYVIDVVMEK